jgi:hypothetical protein
MGRNFSVRQVAAIIAATVAVSVCATIFEYIRQTLLPKGMLSALTQQQ